MAQLPDEMWTKVQQTTPLHDITDKIFKPMMRLSLPAISTCLDTLGAEGVKAFKAKVYVKLFFEHVHIHLFWLICNWY